MIVLPVTAWSNSGGTYGLRLRREDRGYFQKSWQFVYLQLPTGSTEIRIEITDSFWNKCHELRSPEIRNWFVTLGHVDPDTWERCWKDRKPPKFRLIQSHDNHFVVK
jgi:hypothetical protein